MTIAARTMLALVLLVLAGCGWRGPSLAGQPGLQQEVMSFYERRALEENAMCPQPRMTSIARTEVVEDEADRLVMAVRYHYEDEGMSVDVNGGSKVGCDGWGERTFTFARGANGWLDVLAMSGPQRAS